MKKAGFESTVFLFRDYLLIDEPTFLCIQHHSSTSPHAGTLLLKSFMSFFWNVSEPDFELAGGSYKLLHDYEEEEKLTG